MKISRSNYTANETAYITTHYPERPEAWKPINEAQATALFAEHAIYTLSGDAVPLHIAYTLFGYDAVNTVNGWQEYNPERRYIRQYIGAFYVTRAGFMQLVFLLNERAMQQAQDDILEARHEDSIAYHEAEKAAAEAASAKRRETIARKKAAAKEKQQA